MTEKRQETALARTTDQRAMLAERKEMAELLRDFIKQQGLSRNFGGQKDHIFYEGWAFLGEMAGYYTSTESVEELTDKEGNVIGVRATVALKRDQEVMARVTASCTREEPNWKTKPRFQLESMAQTRAASKAFRMRLSPIVALAGFEATPAEELDTGPGNGHASKSPKSSPRGDVKKGIAKIREVLREHYPDITRETVDEWIYAQWGVESLDTLQDYKTAVAIYKELTAAPGKGGLVQFALASEEKRYEAET